MVYNQKWTFFLVWAGFLKITEREYFLLFFRFYFKILESVINGEPFVFDKISGPSHKT